MGGEGSMFDMVNRMKQNHKMLKSKREQIRELRKIYIAHETMQTSKHPVPANIKSIKEEIRKEIHRRKQRAWLISGSFVLILIAGLIILFLYFSS